MSLTAKARTKAITSNEINHSFASLDDVLIPDAKQGSIKEKESALWKKMPQGKPATLSRSNLAKVSAETIIHLHHWIIFWCQRQ